MECLLIVPLAYWNIGRTLALNHALRSEFSQPSYIHQTGKDYFIPMLLWPLGSRFYKPLWFVLILCLTTLLFFTVYLFEGLLIQNEIVRLAILLAFTFTPVTYLLISILFAALRTSFACYRFGKYFFRAVYVKFKMRKETNEYVLERDPSVLSDVLQFSTLHLMSGKIQKMTPKIVASIFFFVDSITWIAAYSQTLAGASKDLHPSNPINEETAISYASQLTNLLRE